MPQIIGGIILVVLAIAAAICAVMLFLTVGAAYGCFSAMANYVQAFQDNVRPEKPPGTP